MIRRRPANAGFTFIEIAVVMVIIAAGTMLAVPAIEGGFDAREVRRAAKDIAVTMLHCRGEAVAKGEVQAVVIDPRRNSVYSTGGGRWAIMTDRAQVERLEGGETLGNGQMRFVFFPNGASSGGDVVVGSRADHTRSRLWIHLDPLVSSVRVDDAPR